MASGNKKAKDKKRPAKRKKTPGTLFIIGGREDKEGDKLILQEIAQLTQKKKMVIATIASVIPDEIWKDYRKIFTMMGCENIVHFNIAQHEEARELKNLLIFEDAHTVFFTGGDQLKITTKIGGTPIYDRIMEIYESGGIIAGTSAGAAIMGNMMLVGGENAESHKVRNWMMAPGLGFIQNIMIDQHFAQRGRIGRLLSAVSINPGILGIGIDEDTSIIVNNDTFRVTGSNAVYVIDGRNVSYTNVSQAHAEKAMSVHDVRLHILASGESFDIETRRPNLSSPKTKGS